jgi:two-component system response regulator YesN
MREAEITLCVIDDIKSVVRGIADMIQVESHGVKVVGTAGNGEDGLQMVMELRPDIVLTDIRMPRMDGLEMTKAIMAVLPNCKVIMLSGYTDFEYAQQALRLGAFDFIAKPFLKAAIEEVVQKAKMQIEQDRIQFAKQSEMERQIKESMPLLRQEYLHLLLRYNANEAKLKERWDYLKLDLGRERLIIMCIEIDGFAKQVDTHGIHDVELARFAVKNILEETLGSVTKSIVFREQLSGFICLLNVPLHMDMVTLAEQCREHMLNYSRYTVSIGVGLEARTIHELPLSYQQASEALSHNFYTGGNSVFFYEDIQRHASSRLRHSAELEKELFNCLRMGNQEKAVPLLASIVQGYSGVQPSDVMNVCLELGLLMVRVFAEKITEPSGMDELTAKLNQLKKGERLTLRELTGLLEQIATMGCDLLQKQREVEADSVIAQAIAHMKANLDKNLTVNDLAKQVYLSGSYFANLFKKVTGTTLIHYMTKLRIERAKEMLLEDEKQVQEVAILLGYEDRSYFTDVFKKHVGMTPTEFKQGYKSS